MNTNTNTCMYVSMNRKKWGRWAACMRACVRTCVCAWEYIDQRERRKTEREGEKDRGRGKNVFFIFRIPLSVQLFVRIKGSRLGSGSLAPLGRLSRSLGVGVRIPNALFIPFLNLEKKWFRQVTYYCVAISLQCYYCILQYTYLASLSFYAGFVSVATRNFGTFTLSVHLITSKSL